MLAHGFGGSLRSVHTQAEEFARRGFVVLTWSARGFGRSTGQIALNSLDREVRDAQKLRRLPRAPVTRCRRTVAATRASA